MARITLNEQELAYVLEKIHENKELIKKIEDELKQSSNFTKMRKKSMLEANNIKSDISKNKVNEAIKQIIKNNEKITSVNVMKYCDVAKNTALKYIREYKKNN